MTDLHILEIDQAGKLVLHYEKANDWRDNWFGSFFDGLDDFEEKDLGDTVDYVCQRMHEKSAVIQNIKWVKDAVEDKFGAEQLEIKPSAQKLLDEGENEDELFQVIKGTLYMQFRDRTEVVKEGELIVVPKGVEHNPCTKNDEEVHVLLFEK